MIAAFFVLWFAASPNRAADNPAEDIIERASVKGGLVVHLGCGNGRLTAALRASDAYVVHGLDTDAVQVAESRKFIRSKGLYGPVSIDVFDGRRLPYVDNLVNLLVADELGDVKLEEVMRVLAPLGVAYVGGEKIVKPWPTEIDEWTHHFHDAGGNPVARDRVVGPPRNLQWTAGPRWARSHEYTPSVSAMVSADGRLFYICDETLHGVDASVPSKWFLSARDAFSGVLLWKRPVPQWGAREHSGTSDISGSGVVGRFTMPAHAGKRLVAVGDTVYITLGATAPVTALDAATGEVRRVYDQTANADEILCVDGRLIVTINPSERPDSAAVRKGVPPSPASGKRVFGLDAKSGRVLWEKGPYTATRSTLTQDPFGRLELLAGDGQAFFLTHDTIESLALDSGKTLWQIDRPAIAESAERKMGFAQTFEFLLSVMVYRDGVLLLAQPEPITVHSYHTHPGALYAFDARDGRQLWKSRYGGWGHTTRPDLFVVDDLVWTHVNAKTDYGMRAWGGGLKVEDTSVVDYRVKALDLKTGELKRELSTKEIFNVGHHHRCYRSKITERFLMASRRGVEFVDLTTGENYQNHWVRSGCLLGNLPCNGLLYVAPHPCRCYIDAKLTGFNALAAERSGKGESAAASDARLEKGPAYGETGAGNSHKDGANDWPTYRGNSRRSGSTEKAVPAELATAWSSNIGGRPSGLVVAGGKVFAAAVDAHTIHALDADDGRSIWTFTAGARVDSPPTVYKGLAIFGSADGRVYCLRAADGALVWRFDAAPQRRLVTSFNQLESPWPVPGSVLERDGNIWFAAGRSSYLDGGIRLFALDAQTGRLELEKTIYSPDPETGKMTLETSANQMAGLLNDIPGSDGADVFIRQMNVSSDGATGKPHLYSTRGFLDASWFNRTYWTVGQAQTLGLMVHGEGAVYGVEFSRSRNSGGVFTPGEKAYRLSAVRSKRPPSGPTRPRKKPRPKAAGNRRAA